MDNETYLDETKIEETEEFIYAFAAPAEFDPDQNPVCFAAHSTGLYRSKNGGKTWQTTYSSLKLEDNLATPAVIVSPDFSHDQQVFAGVTGGVLRSTNAGKTWHVAGFPPPPPMVSTLVISPNYIEDGTIFAGTMEDGVFHSTDRGTSWVGWNFGLLDLNVLCMAISPDFAQDETVFAGTGSGIFRSTNGGRAWRELVLPNGYEAILSLAVSPNFAKDGTIFAGSENQGIFVSNDKGDTWSILETEFEDPVNGIVLSPEFPQTPGILVNLGSQVILSRDGGQSWEELSLTLREDQEISTVFAPRGLQSGAPLLVGLVGGRSFCALLPQI